MALFKKAELAKKAEAKVKEPKVEKATDKESSARSFVKTRGLALDEILRRPHITEKATDLSEKGVYAFEVHPKATKMEVKQAVEKFYKVHARQVAVINTKAKYTRARKSNRIVLKKAGLRKALVTLKAGEKIEFV